MRPRLLLAAGFAIGALAALIGVEIFLLSRREYLPTDPGYVINGHVITSGGASLDPLRLAVLGDSTVAGVGSPTVETSLPVLIGERVAQATGRSVEVAGFGVAGARTATLTAHQLPRIGGGHDVIVLVIGSNDATHATFWPTIGRQTVEMLQRASALGPPVVLAGTPRFSGTEIIPEPLRTMVDRYSAVLRGEQRAAADAVGVRFVDIAAQASPRFEGVPEAMSADGFHPSPIGYGFWADAIASAVVDAVSE